MLAIKINRLHADQVDNTLEILGKSNRQLHQDRIRAKLLANLLADTLRVCPGPVQLVDEYQTGNMVAVDLSVDG